jgi:hypothetical protein
LSAAVEVDFELVFEADFRRLGFLSVQVKATSKAANKSVNPTRLNDFGGAGILSERTVRSLMPDAEVPT